uniref:Piwi domain-containing protein n=2 Tax=Oryza brachyantha TaxID=4533 RepID=J3MKR5_ORYBR
MRTLKGVRIEVTHRGKIRKTYRVSSLTTLSASQLTFKSSTGDDTTVKKYFKEKYGLELSYGHLPCLQVGTDQKPNYLPMEVCKIIPGQRYQKKLNQRQVTQLIASIDKFAHEREMSIRQAVENNQYSSTERAKEFGIEVDSYPTTVNARLLKAPMLKYKNEVGAEVDCEPNNGQWNMSDKKVFNGASVETWACISFCNGSMDPVITNFCNALIQTSLRTGLNFNNSIPQIFHANPDRVQNDLPERYKDACNKLKGQKIDLLLVILPDKDAKLYGDVKRICETEIGVISQCCRKDQLSKTLPPYCANIAIKINAKAGGTNSVFSNKDASLPVVSKKATIIFGADVTHPGPLDDSSPSIASVVASVDWPNVTRYNSVVRTQGNREEIIGDLEGIVKELLNACKSDSNKPEQLIFYRDGVSEGQFNQVLEKEVPDIVKAWKSVYGLEPRITFIVVRKRHHTRLFPPYYTERVNVNVPPGTVVDRKICHPREFDFFLCSHAGIKGTCRPSHYHVLRDDNKFTADDLQSVTNNLCYIYTSCTRSVSIPPPVYYAHKLAFRARFYLTEVPGAAPEDASRWTLAEIKEEVKNSMFFC